MDHNYCIDMDHIYCIDMDSFHFHVSPVYIPSHSCICSYVLEQIKLRFILAFIISYSLSLIIVIEIILAQLSNQRVYINSIFVLQ